MEVIKSWVPHSSQEIPSILEQPVKKAQKMSSIPSRPQLFSEGIFKIPVRTMTA
jgi:hypothetical protein